MHICVFNRKYCIYNKNIYIYMYLDIFIYTYIYPAIATPPAILHMVNVDCRTRTGEPYWWNPLKFMRVLMAMRNSELAGFM